MEFEPIEKILGQNIARERKARGWTQQHLAELSGVTSQQVYRWENGQMPSPTHINNLAQIFGMKPSNLFIDQDNGEQQLVRDIMATLAKRGYAKTSTSKAKKKK